MIARSDSRRFASARAHHAAHVGRDHDEVLVALRPHVAEEHRRGVDVVDRDVEEALDLVRVQVHGQHAGDADRGEHVRHHLGADRDPRRARPAVLARVAEIRDRGGDARGRRALERVDHHHQLHQVVVGRLAGRLQHEHVLAAHVLHDLDHHFAVGELADDRPAERQVEVARHLLREARVGVAREHHQALELRCARSVRHRVHVDWLGRKDSNPRMPESKSGALTSLATPQYGNGAENLAPNSGLQYSGTASGCRSSPRATNPRMSPGNWLYRARA